MRELIEALQILLQYGEAPYPTHCEHDELYVFPAVPLSEIAADDIARLEELGFHPNEDGTGFYSFKFGSC